VAAFHTRLRQTIDLDAVRDDLVGAVHQAFEPAHASVWLAVANRTEQSQSTFGATPLTLEHRSGRAPVK